VRTAIKAGWVVGHSNGAHQLIRNGVLVYEDNVIVFVGTSFDGTVDREIDAGPKLVAPGFIDTHIHYGHRASHRLISDTGRPLFFGQPFLEVTVPRRGKKVTGDARWLAHGESTSEGALDLNATYTVVELIRGGVNSRDPGSAPGVDDNARPPEADPWRSRTRPDCRWRRTRPSASSNFTRLWPST
jgi:cytosine/adenosine deaminase-related metal-dependent hydrolase